MRSICSLSRRNILIAEYFNSTPNSIECWGKKDVLFKRDSRVMFLDLFPAKYFDHGFLWGREDDLAGFGGVTYWLFERLD